jgi:hypothetical protein
LIMETLLEMLTTRGEHLIARFDGPLHFRLIVMPLVVSVLALRAFMKDVREGKPVYLGAFIKDATERRRLLRSGLKDFGKVFVVACVLDTTYQLLVLKSFYFGEMLVVAVTCAIVPYFLIRGPVLRSGYWLYRKCFRQGTDPKDTGH